MKHSEYIKTKKWQQLRAKVFERDNKWCRDCGLVEATEVHHLNYQNYLNESIDDLVSLCRVCHGKRHGLIKTHNFIKTESEMFGGVFDSYSEMIHAEFDRLMDKDD